jgi:hypothetical protein
LYLVLRGSEGEWKVLFPSAKIEVGDNRVRRGTPITVPGGDEVDFEFDDSPGLERIYLVLSKQREEDLDALIRSLRREDGGNRVLARNRMPEDKLKLMARGMSVEKRKKATPVSGDGTREDAVYVVASAQDPRVVAEILLNHQ